MRAGISLEIETWPGKYLAGSSIYQMVEELAERWGNIVGGFPVSVPGWTPTAAGV
jgi:hypothetical protein